MCQLRCTMAGLTSVALPYFTSFLLVSRFLWHLQSASASLSPSLPLSICLYCFVSWAFSSIQHSLLHYRSNTFLTRSLSGAVNCTLSVSLLPHKFVCTHTDERQSQRETQPEPSKGKGRRSRALGSRDQGGPMSGKGDQRAREVGHTCGGDVAAPSSSPSSVSPTRTLASTTGWARVISTHAHYHPNHTKTEAQRACSFCSLLLARALPRLQWHSVSISGFDLTPESHVLHAQFLILDIDWTQPHYFFSTPISSAVSTSIVYISKKKKGGRRSSQEAESEPEKPEVRGAKTWTLTDSVTLHVHSWVKQRGAVWPKHQHEGRNSAVTHDTDAPTLYVQYMCWRHVRIHN